MLSDRARVLNYFYRLPYTSTVIDFQDLLINTFINVLKLDKLTAEAYASRHLKVYWNELIKQQEENEIRGIKPLFTIVDDTLKKVSFDHLNLLDTMPFRQKIVNSLLRARPLILDKIDLLNDREYEALACFVCELLGANNIKLTPPGNEGGIDFLATIKFTERSHYLFGVKGPIRIIGQCKKYSTKMQVDKVKEFITTLQEVKNQNPSVERIIPNWFRTSTGPVIGWIISHTGFQSGSLSKSQCHGILMSDSIDIAQLISLCNKYYITETPHMRASKLKICVQEALVKYE